VDYSEKKLDNFEFKTRILIILNLKQTSKQGKFVATCINNACHIITMMMVISSV
jgi:hypothetical protein